MSALTRSKSLFVEKPKHEDYLGPGGLQQVVSAVDDEEEEGSRLDLNFGDSGVNENPEGVLPPQEGPFSALTPSMWPSNLSQPESKDDIEHFDEFGFRIDREDGPEDTSNRLLSQPFQDDPQKRLKWIAHMEFAQASNGNGDTLGWDRMVENITRTEKLRAMVKEGVPHSLRSHIWMRLSGAIQKRQESDVTYKQIVRASSNDHLMTSRQIEKDLLRTMPTNACFNSLKATGIPRLRRILRGIAWLYPDIGYCQGMGMIVAIFLLIMEEEDSFWIMASVVEELLPASYFSPSLVGAQADQLVLRGLIASCLPNLDGLLQEHDIEISLITLNWFLTLYSSVLHIKILLRLWDLILCEGSKVLFQIALGMLRLHETELSQQDNSAAIFNFLSTLPIKINDIDSLMKAMEDVRPTITDIIIEDNRRRHVAFLLSEQGSWRGDLERHITGSKIKLTKRTMKRSKSVMDLLLFPKPKEGQNNSKSKNIMQTEVLINLREAILRLAQYFQAADPASFADVDINADYSMESHVRDHETFLAISKSKRKRARAVLDFERRDDDELGFRKNDIITIISQRDEHCWVGELNGLQGWFPAKLVTVLDERSKQYSFAGDDSVSQAVTDLVRGSLCPAIKQVLEHGLRRSPLLLGPCHPWLFIEEAALKEVEKDFKSVYSRLVLCKTFRLNEDGKVLSPEELLFRCVEAVNFTHNPSHAQMDVKLRSLVAFGLNEQVLHLWLEALASNEDVVRKWFHPWSFMSSPGWVQIKCELRILSQFSFNLNPDWEVRSSLRDEQKPLQEGVKDMLVKHHLFSWDL
ncbi:hypothetical protein TCAL_07812 [Tigriopus californicus]|uniref:RUN and TBC1 domain-containing protein 3 n=1 Tax=Tigriopus californicus TaxID=6832 RepID=A0A553NNN0_TIGCA|nr:small G protein signaling modulator 3 homolog [Tigriopus californicus]TRY67052.1 hypothetical protein TCAL_07812 [Tigriopus californicus]